MRSGPLRWQPLFVPFLVFARASCALNSSEPPSPLQQKGMRATTIAVAPFNIAVSLPRELESSTQLVSDALIEHLVRLGKKPQLLETRRGTHLWVEATKEIGESGGALNFDSAAGLFARKVRQRTDFDAIIIPSLYIQNATAGPESARWDGANQQIEFIGRARKQIEMPPSTTIKAASILVSIFDPEGNKIHSKRTGLELIQHMEIRIEYRQGYDKRIWALKSDDPAIEDEVRVRAALAHSLYPYLSK